MKTRAAVAFAAGKPLEVMEVDLEVHEDEFTYWRKHDRQGRARK